MQIDMNLDKGLWKDLKGNYEGVRVRIRPYPMSLYDENKGIESRVKKMYEYCLLEQEALKDNNGENIIINDKTKQYLYDYYYGFVSEVIRVIKEDSEDRNLKN